MVDNLKLGLVGASASGGWSPVAHIPALKALENIELEAVCTSRPESAKAASKAFGIERAYHNVDELVSQPDIDIVSVVVKIPSHYKVVRAALEAGKHVYCEWPLGANLQETEELTNLANAKGLVTAIGLQGHWAPEFLYIKRLVEEAWLGQVLNIKMSMQTKASLSRASKEAWDDELARKATLFSIVGGHTLYYLSNVFGGILEVSGQLSTQLKQITLGENGERVNNPIPDQIVVNGLLKNDIPFACHISSVPFHSKGWRMEVHGTEGTLVATSTMLPQITPIKLKGAKGDSELESMPVPKELVAFNYLPEGPAGNVGRNYGRMAQAILSGKEFLPSFNDALTMHRLLESIHQSSEEKRTIEIASNNK